MITKEYTPKKTVCKVTFTLPADSAAEGVSLVGDFNNWDPAANKLDLKNGNWQTTIRLTPGSETRFRYFADGANWINDDAADEYVANSFGSDDSVVKVA